MLVDNVKIEEIVYALKLLGGVAKVGEIKDKVTELKGGVPSHYRSIRSFRETIQRKIEDHCPQSLNYKENNKIYFERIGRGIYKLNDVNTNIFDEIEVFKNNNYNLEKTTLKTIIESRLGQGLFRKKLIEIWKGCAVTGYKEERFLIASHIKPWRISNNKERLDGYNGLLLLPNIDKVFDLGYITFDINGKIIISSKLNNYEFFGLSKDMEINMKEENKKYMEYHNLNVFVN